MSYILALNCGSASLKYQVFTADSRDFILGGYVERIGLADSFVTQKYKDGSRQVNEVFMENHSDALNIVIDMLRGAGINLDEITGVGHRVVHGGDKFAASVEITDEVIDTIDELSVLAPLHNPANLVGIVAAKQLLPNAKQVAIFDTAFHQTMPDYAYRYAVPGAWYRELGVRRYGFHGTSHLYVSKRAAAMLGRPAKDVNLITMHIGSGASCAAIRGGLSVDTSLGMTPLSGLTMETRPGDLDPGAVLYIMERLGLNPAQMQMHLNKQAGMLGLSEKSKDHRDIMKNLDDDNCRLALEQEAHTARKYLGGYLATLGQVDAIVFTAGVGENNPTVREMICKDLENFGVKLDSEINNKTFAFKGSDETVISAPDSKIKVMMIPTNEEIVIVEDTLGIMNGTYKPNHLEMIYSFL